MASPEHTSAHRPLLSRRIFLGVSTALALEALLSKRTPIAYAQTRPAFSRDIWNSESLNPIVAKTELNFLNSKAWIPGKASYETMTITYIDVAPTRRESANLYAYLGSVYQFHNSDRKMGSAVRDYTATGTLTLYDGCGTPIEDWQFEDLWPQAINFGDLDQSSSDTVDIELTMRYSKFTYNPRCGNVDWGICCSGCSKVAGPPSR
jgi:hypothetical protein